MADYTQYALPFMGSTNGGNDFPGVSRPFGMVKVGPDNIDGKLNAYAGYLPNGAHTGFSMMHLSGTGGAPTYGVISQLPVVGDVVSSVARSGQDMATVGYYKSTTAQGVTVELGASEHAAMYQYTFPPNGGSVVVDLSHLLPSFRGQGLDQGFSKGTIKLAKDHYEGGGTYKNGYNRAPDWTVYFCGYFDPLPDSSKLFNGTSGATFSFSTSKITSRVGISFISSNQACHSVQNEIPPVTTLSRLVSDTKSIWNDQVLSKVTTTETNVTDLQLLYSSVYHMHLLPSNRTGENPLWKSAEPYYDDFFTLWDLHRTSTPLLHILQPTAYQEVLRSLIDTWRHEGYLPCARSANFNGPVQGGTFADQILADAYVKGMKGINWGDAYSAMVTNAEVVPQNNHDPRAPDSSTKNGRGALPDWKERGFITSTYSRAGSRAVDYSTNDFGLYQVATGLGHSADAGKYLDRSRNWRNHWNQAATSLGFSGFVMPRNESGFVNMDPLSCCGFWEDPYYEASAWEYSLGPLHDIPYLVSLSGGSQNFVKRLQTMFTPGGDPENKGTIIDPGNEVSFATPYLFNFAGRQDLSVSTSRGIARSRFFPTSDGLPGNGDSGAMQSWLLWNMIGLYPLTGQTTFLIHAPWFEQLTIDLGTGKKLSVSSSGGDKDSKIYVQSLKVNGKAWKKPYLDWNDVFANGGSMDFALGSTPNNGWFSGPGPTSPASQKSVRRNYTNAVGGEGRSSRTYYPLVLLLLMIPIICGGALFWSWIVYWSRKTGRRHRFPFAERDISLDVADKIEDI